MVSVHHEAGDGGETLPGLGDPLGPGAEADHGSDPTLGGVTPVLDGIVKIVLRLGAGELMATGTLFQDDVRFIAGQRRQYWDPNLRRCGHLKPSGIVMRMATGNRGRGL